MKNGQNGSGVGIVVIVIIAILLLGSCAGSSSDDEYRKTLESGQRKYYTGEDMSREEYNAVKGFNEWKSKQGDKSYSEWDK